MVEKSEYRASGAQAIGKLVTKMPCPDYATFVKWLYNYSLNTRVRVHKTHPILYKYLYLSKFLKLIIASRLHFPHCVCLQVVFRMFALDVAMVLLAQKERQANEALQPDLALYLSHRFLVRSVVYGRRSDVSPTVRAHAMHCLAQCLELPSRNATKWIQELFSSSSISMLSLCVILNITVIATLTKCDVFILCFSREGKAQVVIVLHHKIIS